MDKIHSGEQHSSIQAARRGLGPLALAALLAILIDGGAYWVLGRIELGQTARILVALAPLVPDIVLLVMILQRIRRLDEFQQRVQLEAVVVAYLSTGVAVFVYAYLQKAHAVGPLNMELVWAFMLVFYAVGYALAVRHYQ